MLLATGLFEINGDKIFDLRPSQVVLIQKHLNMVFFHEIDPSFGKNKNILLNIHSGTKSKESYPAKDSEKRAEDKYSPRGDIPISC